MKISKDKTITCSAAMMASILEIMTSSVGSGNFNWLKTADYSTPTSSIVHFKSGAQLGRRGRSEWYIYGAVPGTADFVSAFCELEAANHVRRAISLLKSSQTLLRTPYSQQIVYRGLWGIDSYRQIVKR